MDFFYTKVLNLTTVHLGDLGDFYYKKSHFIQGTLIKYNLQLKYISYYTYINADSFYSEK